MYLKYFDLQREPFEITPDPRFLYLSVAHREAFAAIVYGVNQRKGLVSITGEVGTGKTLILRAFLDGLNPELTKGIYIVNPLASFDQILREILPSCAGLPLHEQLRAVEKWLLEEYREGRNVVLVLDEAQQFELQTLERLRLLSNLETAEAKLIQIVLAGQPELEQKLDQPTLRQLKQRIAVRARIDPLTSRESPEYIQHRLSTAKRNGSEVFTDAAVRRIARYAKGNPRALNILCDNALVAGYGYQRRPVSARVAARVIADYRGSHGRPLLTWARTLPLFVLPAIAFLIGWDLGDVSRPEQQLSLEGGTADEVLDAVRSTSIDDAVILALVPSSEGDLLARSVRIPKPTEESESTRAAMETELSTIKGAEKRNRPLLQDTQDPFPMTVVVREGDGLWPLTRQVYGFATKELVELLIQANSHIRDPNTLSVGDKLVFPDIRDEEQFAFTAQARSLVE